jgi:hypothetical protein
VTETETQVWFGIELWIPEPGFWWSSGTRFDTEDEAAQRATEVERRHRLTKFTLIKEPVVLAEYREARQ